MTPPIHAPAAACPDAPTSTRDFRRRMAAVVDPLQTPSAPATTGVIAAQWLTMALAAGTAWAAKRGLTGSAGLLQGWGQLSIPHAVLLAALLAACVLVMLSRQHALGVLLHDASHGRLYVDRQVNDTAGNWTCAFPLFLSVAAYRLGHLPHHLFTNTGNDPHWKRLRADEGLVFPMPKRRLARVLAADLVGFAPRGLALARALCGPEREKALRLLVASRSDRWQLAAFWLLAAAALTAGAAWSWFVLLWLLPRFVLLAPVDRLRLIAEHDLESRADEFGRTRTVRGTWLERLLFAPLNINYHVEHHLFPGVPLYRLRTLHRLLAQQPEYRASVHVWPSYFSGRDSLFNHLTTCEANGANRLAIE